MGQLEGMEYQDKMNVAKNDWICMQTAELELVFGNSLFRKKSV